MTSERAKKWLIFGEFCYLNGSWIRKSIALMFMGSSEKWIHAFVSKLGNRCFCWFLSAISVSIRIGTSMASPYKPLKIWVKHFFGYLVYEIFLWPESWRGSLHIYSLHLPDSGLCLINGLIYILIHFECRDAENQQSWQKKSSRRYAYYSKSFFSSFIYLFIFLFSQHFAF